MRRRASGWATNERPSGMLSNPSSSPPSEATSVPASPVMERRPRLREPTASPLQPLQPLHRGGALFFLCGAHLALDSTDASLA